MPPTARRVAVLLSVLVLAACGDERSADDERRRLAEDLIDQVGDGLGREEADCVAAGLQEEYGDGAFRQVVDAAEARPDDEEVDSVRATVIDIFAACDALSAVTTTAG